MPRFSWSEESLIQLKALIAEKHTAGRIAAILSALLKVRITRNAVIGKCHRDGIKLAQTRQGRPRNPDGTPPARRPRGARSIWALSFTLDPGAGSHACGAAEHSVG